MVPHFFILNTQTDILAALCLVLTKLSLPPSHICDDTRVVSLVKFELRCFMSEQGESVCSRELRAAAEASCVMIHI